MIFRAIFWIGLVSLLMPHEPDLGLGRPGAGTSLSVIMKNWPPQAALGTSCDGDLGACAGGLGRDIRGPSGRSLADVKAEIDESIKARGKPLYAL